MKNNKVVIITGASSGIGLALAKNYIRRNFNVVISARNIDKLNEIIEKYKELNSNVIAVQTDVSIESDCRNLIEKTIEKFGVIDILINNAGISMRAAFDELETDVIRRLMDVNFWGTLYCSKFAVPYLLKSKGSLVAVSSIAGYKGLPGRTGYSASKFAIHGLYDVLRIEYLKKDLHIMIACPGFTASNIRFSALTKDGTPQGSTPREEAKMMSPDVVAEKIINGINKRKRTVVMTLEGKAIVWLNKFFPKLMDKMVFNSITKEPDSPIK